MNIKDIIVGDKYILYNHKKSRVGLSWKYFKYFQGQELIVTSKYQNFNNKNIVQIQGMYSFNDEYSLITFWCSPYDLKEIF